jgi:hypothetical protein
VKIGKLQRLHNLLVTLADFNGEAFRYVDNGPDVIECPLCGASTPVNTTPLQHDKKCIWVEAQLLRKELTDGDPQD